MESLGKLSTVTLADVVERKIYEYIKKNNLQQGDLLPREEEFAKGLNVSRHILREALSRLRMLGLIESRRKKGMVVTKPNGFIGLDRLISNGIIDKETQKELTEMRIIIELGMADYIFHRKTEKNIEELLTIITKDGSTEMTLEEERKMELDFHAKLYDIAGNQTTISFQYILKSFFREIEKNKRKTEKHKGIATHKKICEVLKKGTAEEFRKIMHEHLKVYMVFKKTGGPT